MERPSPYADSPLLAEVHRTFPALLYDPGRFRNIQDVFRYVQGQMRARYDVFSNSQRAFQADDPVYQSRRLVFTMPAQMPEMFVQPSMSDPLTTLLYSLSTPPVLATTPETRAPPSREQIRAASTLHSQAADSETPCAVCQDSIVSDDIIRKLNGCNHAFHIDCIDTWFQRSSLCPTCRHDIVPAAATTAAVAAAAAGLDRLRGAA